MTDPPPCPCEWDDRYEVEDLPPMAYTVEGFRSFYRRPLGVPVAPHSLGPATGVEWLELGRSGRAALG